MTFFDFIKSKKTPSPSLEVSPQSEPQPGLQHVKHVVAIASGKGGVGKSTVTTQLARTLKQKGLKVGLLDADIYGPSQSVLLGAQGQRVTGLGPQAQELKPIEWEGMPFISMSALMSHDGPVVWRAPMAMKIIQQFLQNTHWGTLDYLLIDLPPGTGDVQLTLAQQAQLSGAIIVTTPQEIAANIAKKGLQMFEQVQVPILGIIENMSGFLCPNCETETAIFKTGGGKRLAEELQVPFLGAIPLDPAIMLASDQGRPANSPAFEKIAETFHRTITELSRGGKFVMPSRIEVTSPSLLEIDWGKGEKTAFSAFHLRTHCGCAHCIDENTGKKLLDPTRISPQLEIQGISPVGRYAISISFSDGHSTGIYPFEKLKTLPQEVTTPLQAQLQAQSPANTKPAPSSDELSLESIRKAIDDEINPSVASHGGKIEAVSLDHQVLSIRMQGGCQGCAASQVTLKNGVEKLLFGKFPSLKEIIDVTDHSSGIRPFFKH